MTQSRNTSLILMRVDQLTQRDLAPEARLRLRECAAHGIDRFYDELLHHFTRTISIVPESRDLPVFQNTPVIRSSPSLDMR